MQNVTTNGTLNGTVNVTPCEAADGTIIKTHKTADNESQVGVELTEDNPNKFKNISEW